MKPDLMFGCLGNGLTVCDRARQENGDYKHVAHIDPCGAFKLFDKSLPPEALQAINAHALRLADDFRARFLRLRDADAMDELYALMTPAQQLMYTSEGGPDREYMYGLYIRFTCENHGYSMPRPSA